MPKPIESGMGLSRRDTRAAGSLAAVLSVRLLGLFMIYPVFAAYAEGLTGSTAFTIGLALGIYGLTQGLLQIPFGLVSDRIGRKVVIVTGLVLFAIGSVVAALATSIEGVIIGRALQGGGAIGSVVLALVADLTADAQRTRAMAIVGISIGLSFMVAVVAGPALAGVIGVGGLFWLMAGLAMAAIAITLFVVPDPEQTGPHADAGAIPALLGAVLRDRELQRLDFGIFCLHAMLTASFLAVPALMAGTLGLDSDSQWMAYLPVLVASVAIMAPAIIMAERHGRMKAVFVGAVAAMAVSQGLLLLAGGNAVALIVGVLVFFSGFNIMEASLPSLVTRTAPRAAKGTATGIYSSAQFIGIFVGGAAGGWAHQAGGNAGVFAFTLVVALAWFAASLTMKPAGARREAAPMRPMASAAEGAVRRR